MDSKKKNKILINIIAVVVILLVIGVSYALWFLTKEQTNENIVNTACLDISIDDEAGDITLDKAFPIEDSEGEKLEPYTFSVHNKCSDLATYQINLESLNKVTVENRLDSNYIKVKLNEVGKTGIKNILGNLSTTDTTIADTYESHKLLNGYLEPNATKNFELRLWLDENVTKEDEVMDKQFKSKVSITSTYVEEEDVLTFADAVVQCGQGGSAATICITDNMNLDESLINDDFGNLRYTGAEPNNYVDIGDVDEEGQPILWRIIGIIDNKLKIIRNENIGGMPWDSVDRTDILWENSELKEYLNTTYKIDSTLITEELWNVGVADKIDYTAKEFYELERKSNWLGKVGLIGASDYGYAVGGDNRTSCLKHTLNNYNSDNCATNNWLKTKEDDRFYWTIVKEKWRFDYALLINEEGAVSSDYLLNGGGLYKVFPVVYLNENVRITSGSGTDSSPYHLEL